MLEKDMSLDGKTILITGCAGFIGAALAVELLRETKGVHIVGIDNMNDYYDVALKEHRLGLVQSAAGRGSRFTFIRGSIAEQDLVREAFRKYKPTVAVNLAAQAGVRHSIENPGTYIESNITGFFNMLEACRHSSGDGGGEHFLFASSSSVYGNSKSIPYSTSDRTDCPVSLYAATKKADELLAYSYAKLYGIPMTGLRFFTVYGPAGRPDMAYFDFSNRLTSGKTIQVYNYGNCRRDFTYIDDVVAGIRAAMERAPREDEDSVRYKVYNIGNHSPVKLLDFVHLLCGELERAGLLGAGFDLGSQMRLVGMQPGDVESTYADISETERDFGFRPKTGLQEGLKRFVEWYSDYYR